jgi:hypothetical protein
MSRSSRGGKDLKRPTMSSDFHSIETQQNSSRADLMILFGENVTSAFRENAYRQRIFREDSTNEACIL